MTFQLRPYQDAIIEDVRGLLRGGTRSVLIESPTGSGKTALTAFMLAAAAKRGRRAWFIVHRRELVLQSTKTFRFAGVDHGIVAPGFPPLPSHPIQICSIQTIARRLDRYAPPDLIVWDECHHVAARSWARIHATFPKATHIGLTATPERLDGQGLADFFDEMVRGPSVRWLIDQGFLAPYRYYVPSRLDLSAVGNRAGDFSRDELGAVVDKPTITGDAIKTYLRLARGKRAVVFCVTRKHSMHMVQQAREAGIRAAHVDGDTPTAVRDACIREFDAGGLDWLSNVDLFGEGFDLPALEVAILMRPTQSLGLFLQQVGRSLRPAPGKQHAIILDHAGNVQRHGLPDIERDWRLDQPRRRKKQAGAECPVRTCEKCYAALPISTRVCPYCQAPIVAYGREYEEVAGELRELTAEEREQMRLRARTEQGRAETLPDLVALGKQRGYKNPTAWAVHVLRARMAKRGAAVVAEGA